MVNFGASQLNSSVSQTTDDLDTTSFDRAHYSRTIACRKPLGPVVMSTPVVGQLFKVREAATTSPWPGDTPESLEAEALYEVIGNVEAGWDFKRVDGRGPEHIRILESQIPTFLEPAD